jgi:NAD(P)-dependent dehydrogenase (short-subunit alcohol dehydrogenase family)
MSKVIIVTGAGRGLGTDIAREALKVGHRVVATGRRPEQVEQTLGGPQENLLVAKLDITSLADARDAAQAALDRFGRIDILINNAGNFFAGYFEEITPEQMRRQFETNLFGPMNVTRAVLPVLRGQRAGHVITLSSSAGLIGQEFCVAYAASKFAVEGWMESLRYDVEPYNTAPRSWNPASSAPSCWWTPPPPGPSRPSRTTPSAPPPPSRRGRA